MTNAEKNGASESDTPDYSRANARNRWEREGIAQKVADFRWKIRKELRASGMTKKEAGNRMWELALKKFPSPEDTYQAKLLEAIEAAGVIQARGENRPKGVETIQVDGLSFASVWIAFHVALAARFYMERFFALPSEFQFTESELRREFAGLLKGSLRSDLLGVLSLLSPSAATRAVVSLAINDFAEFLAIAERMFKAAIEQVESADGASDDDLDALEKAMGELVSLQVPIVLPADAKAAGSTLAT